ncbi:MAG: type IV pilus modification protein PilV [Rhodanobacter sp.]
MRLKSRQHGVSLIEVLMAVLIFSIGLIGLAGLLVISTRSNHAAYLRTQATFLANNMADRMRANPVGVWNASYDSTSYPITGSTDCQTAACSPADIATRDKQTWSSLLTTLLPNATAGITCSARSSLSHTVTTDEMDRRPPYGGTCAMTISWSERGSGDQTHSDAAPKTFAWEFQP